MARASSTVLAHVPHLGILLRKRRFPISFLTPCCLIHSSQSLSSGPTISSRKQVTVINDDARVQWKDLSGREKVARTTRQTFNLGVILTGLLMTGGVLYLLYTENFAAESKVRHFNRAVDKVRSDPRATEILGSGATIRAFGEPTTSKWSVARPIASNRVTDNKGIEHFRMRFNVEGSSKSGVVNLRMIRRPGQQEFEYRYLALDVEDYPRLYLIREDDNENEKKKGLKMLGVHWKRNI